MTKTMKNTHTNTHIHKKVEVLEYSELGMEAIWRIVVEDFPAFIVIDDKGNDFYNQVTTSVEIT